MACSIDPDLSPYPPLVWTVLSEFEKDEKVLFFTSFLFSRARKQQVWWCGGGGERG